MYSIPSSPGTEVYFSLGLFKSEGHVQTRECIESDFVFFLGPQDVQE